MRKQTGKTTQAIGAQLGAMAAKAVVTKAQQTDDLIEQIIADFTPVDHLITINLNNKVLTFNAALDRKIMNGVKARALAFAQQEITHPDPEVNLIYQADPETKAQASILAEMSVEPKVPIFQFLKLAHRATLSFDTIFNKWAEAHGSRIIDRDVNLIERAVKRIDRDPIWRMRLKAAKEAYHQHPDQLDGGTYEDIMLLDFVALMIVEGREINEATAQ